MCTAVTYQTHDFYFGRNLDYEFSYGESVTVTPRHYPFSFINGKKTENHAALIGMAHVLNDYPLYYDAVNEHGLCMAGLNFPGNAYYPDANEIAPEKEQIAPFEFVPYVLAACATVGEARELLENACLVNVPFSQELPPAPLHYMIADKSGCLVVEPTKEGLMLYDNPVGVLTNNPPFPMQLTHLSNYASLSRKDPIPSFAAGFTPQLYSRGMGGIGLPGDVSSMSRFVRAAFVRMNSVSGTSEKESVSQFFHILGAVEQVRGECELANGKFEITIYSACCNADKGIYYYTTYDDRSICACDMHSVDLDGQALKNLSVVSAF